MTDNNLSDYSASDKPLRIACIGECMIELQEGSDGKIQQGFSGDTFNTATYLSRLLARTNTEVHYVSALGTDRFSRKMEEYWKAENIRTDYLRYFDDKQPGLYYVELDKSGERSFSYWRNEAAAKFLFEGDKYPDQLKALSEFDYIYFSGITLAIYSPDNRQKLLALAKSARENNCKICFDNNYRPKLWRSITETREWYQKALAVTDIALLTLDDERALWGSTSVDEVYSRYKCYQIPEIILKCGAAPCQALVEESHISVSSQKLSESEIVDTNAAGDSFSAAYLAAKLTGINSTETCITWGHKLASTVIQHRGAIIPAEHMPELE